MSPITISIFLILFVCFSFVVYLFYKIISEDAEHRGWKKGYEEASERYTKEHIKLKNSYSEFIKKLGQDHAEDMRRIVSTVKVKKITDNKDIN